MTDPYPVEWACGNCHRKYVRHDQAERCCTRGWAV